MSTKTGAALLDDLLSIQEALNREWGAPKRDPGWAARVAAIEAQAAQAERERLRLAVEGLPRLMADLNGDMFEPGPDDPLRPHAGWLFRAAVLRLLEKQP